MKMRAMVIMLVAWILLCPMLYSETLYVDCTKGRDDHPGTEEQPLKTIGQAVALANDSIIHHGPVSPVKAKTVEVVNSPKMPKDCLHVQPGTLGSELGAGLLKWPTTK